MVTRFAANARESGILVTFSKRVHMTCNDADEITAPHQVSCKICGLKSKTRKIHKDHFRGSHDHDTNKVSRGTLKCPICDYGR